MEEKVPTKAKKRTTQNQKENGKKNRVPFFLLPVKKEKKNTHS